MLEMIAKHYGREVDLDYIKKLCKTNSEGTTLLDLSTASEKIGFNTLKAKVSKSDIDKSHYLLLHIGITSII
jgi:ABC-type bacteriocin/lantibiotic exporter with double-glycine peptidase domain